MKRLQTAFVFLLIFLYRPHNLFALEETTEHSSAQTSSEYTPEECPTDTKKSYIQQYAQAFGALGTAAIVVYMFINYMEQDASSTQPPRGSKKPSTSKDLLTQSERDRIIASLTSEENPLVSPDFMRQPVSGRNISQGRGSVRFPDLAAEDNE